MTLTQRNHYVPVCLLVRFTDPNEKIWVYDKEGRDWFCTNPINVAVEKDMYPQEVEDWLSKEVESQASPIFEKLSKRDANLSEREMRIIANFISEQLARVPTTRSSTSQKYDAPGSKGLNELMLVIANELNLLEQYSDFSMSSSYRESLQRFVQLSESDPERFRAEIGLPDSYTAMLGARIRTEQPSRLADFLMRLAWRLIYSERERYVLSDNPVAVWDLGKNERANSEQFECVLPISANCGIHIGRYGQGGVVNEVSTNDGLVRRFNARILARAQRFIYSSRKERWIAKNAHYKSPRLPHVRFNGPVIQAKYDRPPCSNCGREFTQEEWDTAKISYKVEEREEGDILAEIKTMQHSCQG